MAKNVLRGNTTVASWYKQYKLWVCKTHIQGIDLTLVWVFQRLQTWQSNWENIGSFSNSVFTLSQRNAHTHILYKGPKMPYNLYCLGFYTWNAVYTKVFMEKKITTLSVIIKVFLVLSLIYYSWHCHVTHAHSQIISGRFWSC